MLRRSDSAILLLATIITLYSFFIPAQAFAWQPPVDPENRSVGYWNAPFQWHHDGTGVHMILMRGSTESGEGSHSQVLYYFGGGSNPFSGVPGTNQPRVWKLNPYDAFACSGGACDDTISVTTYPYDQNPKIPLVPCDVNLFCSGHTGLSDGRILVSGGTEAGEGNGIDGVRIFDPATRSFSSGPTMTSARWYPTATTLQDGSVLTTGGSKYKQLVAFGGQRDTAAFATLGATLGLRYVTVEDPTSVSGILPPARHGHMAVFDVTNRESSAETHFKNYQRMLVFGGEDGHDNLVSADLWALTRDQASNWQWNTVTPQTGANGAPSARSGHAAYYYFTTDRESSTPDSGAVFIFGGETVGGLTSELWRLECKRGSSSSDQWLLATSDTTTMPRRRDQSMVFQRLSASSRLIVFGGKDGGTTFNDLWQIQVRPSQSTTWSQVTPDTSLDGAPLPRWGHVCVLDTLSTPDRMIVFGGRYNSTLFNDVWVLSLPDGGTPQWDRIDPDEGDDGVPTARFGSAGIFDPNWLRLVVVGGDTTASSGDGETSDEWSLPLGSEASVEWREDQDTLPSGGRAGLSAVFDDRWQENGDPEVLADGGTSWSLLGAQKFQVRYPFMFVLPTGKLFYAGELSNTYLLDPGAPGWSAAKRSPPSGDAYDGGSAVMYLPGRIMKCGSGEEGQPVKTTMVINLAASSDSAWRPIQDMNYARVRHNLVILPNGKVIAIGGIGTSDAPVYTPEIWDPSAERWEVSGLASDTAIRDYHSTALLLPDGRILSAGGNLYEDRKGASIFWPPYLFDDDGDLAVRPEVVDLDSVLTYGEVFDVTMADTTTITRVALVRPGAVTHQFDQNGRYVPLNYCQNGDQLEAIAPPDGNWAPPGDYLLFVINNDDVPSIASWVRIGDFETESVCEVSECFKRSGVLSTNEVWTNDNGPHALSGPLTIFGDRTLTITAGTTVLVDSAASLTVKGTLNVLGNVDAPVVFRSCSEIEGSWGGIKVVGDSASAAISYADIQYATKGVRLVAPGSAVVSHCTLSNNQIIDIEYVGNGADTLDFEILSNTMDIGNSGSAIVVDSLFAGGEITGNVISGTMYSSSAVVLDSHLNSGADVAITGNTISGCSNAAGLYIKSGAPVVAQNEVSSCSKGISVEGGAPVIGTSSSSSDNLLHNNTTGIYARCAASQCSTATCTISAVVRNNQIYSNASGVRIDKTPTSGGYVPIDLGTSGDYGNNSIYGNSAYCIRASSACDSVHAWGNWFDTDCNSLPTCYSGLVKMGAILCSQPAGSPHVGVEPVAEQPARTVRLIGVTPNPTRGDVTLRVELVDGTGIVEGKVFDISGRRVRDLGEREASSGLYSLTWDGRAESGARAPSGIYFIRVAVNGRVLPTSKILVTR